MRNHAKGDIINVGIIGAGGIALNHAGSINAYQGARLAAVADVNAGRRKELAAKFGIPKTYDSAKALIADRTIDAVIISLPNFLHLPVSLEALKNGKHVLLEKPMALNMVEAKKIAAAARRYRRVLMLGMNLRFRPTVQTIKTLLARGDLGKIYHVKAYWLRRCGCPKFGTWFGRKDQAGGGAMLDLGVHVLDAALYILIMSA